MKFTQLATAVLLATFARAQQPDPQINTPVGVTQCQVTSLTFSGSHPPFVISAIPGGQVGSTPFEEIVTTSNSPYAWLCNLAQGTYLTLQIRDNDGSLQYSSPISVLNSSNSSCVGQGGSVTVTNSATLPGTTSTPASGSTTSPAGTTTTSKPGSTTAKSASTSTPTSSKSAASHLEAQFLVAGALSLVGAVLMM
jgi:hypothetical protein